MHNSEELYFATLNSLTAHIAVLDKTGNIIAVNDAWQCFAKANQASKGLIRGVGLNYLQACETARGPSREGALQCLAGLQAVLNGTLAEFELEYPCHSPTEQRWFFLRAVPLLHRAGGLVISHINITERKRGEQTLQESREKIQLLLNSTAEAIYGLDLEGRCTFCNPAALRFLGYEQPAQLLGKRMHNLVHHTRPDGTVYPQEECPIYRAFRRNIEAHGDDELLWRSDGTSFPAEYWSHPIHRAGKIVGAVVTFLDITERKRAMQEIQRIRSYLANIVDSMPSMLIGVDLEGNVTEWNQGAEKATGITAAAALGQALTQLFPHHNALSEKLNKAIQQRRPIPSERIISTKNGEYIYADVVIYPLLVANEVMGAVVRIDNVTDRVRLEQLLVQSEKMLSIGGLAAGMAHELNNPLGVILQGSQTILRRLTAELPANQQVATTLNITLEQVNSYLEQRRITDFLNDIREAARRAAHIVADMLAFSERSHMGFTPARLDTMLDTAITLASKDYDLLQHCNFQHIEIVRDYFPDLESVICNQTALEQVFLNLIKNAAQAMADAATPLPHRIVLRTRRETHDVRIEIEDNGPGIDEQTRRHIFEPFFTTKPTGKGTGLGLSVSYFIITQQHNGRISVKSTPHKGTCFVIHLPLHGHSSSA